MSYIDEEQQPELIRDLPRAVQPITRLNQFGPEALSDAELLSLVLRSRSLTKTEELIKTHTLKGLLEMKMTTLSIVRGVTDVGAAALLAACELTRRVDNVKPSGLPEIRTMNDVVIHAVEIRDKKKEYLLAFFMNARNQLIVKETISIGTLTASLAGVREIFAPAIGRSAANFVLVHNHPSGNPSPSDEDIRLTKRIAQAGHIMGIELLDHVIVAEQGSYSFKTAGQL